MPIQTVFWKMFEFKIAAARWGNTETDTAIAPVVVVSIFTNLLLGTQLIKQRNWFISFYKITPATTAFISTPPLCRCHQEPESNIAWF